MNKVVFESNTVDTSTGEILSSTKIIKRELSRDKFLRVYIDDICKLAKCCGAETSIILASLQFVDYSTNEIVINSTRRKQIAESAGIKDSTFNVNLGRLIKKNIIVKIDNIHYLNPRLFFFGSDIDRENILKLTLEYIIKD
jgi:hypothetical protein